MHGLTGWRLRGLEEGRPPARMTEHGAAYPALCQGPADSCVVRRLPRLVVHKRQIGPWNPSPLPPPPEKQPCTTTPASTPAFGPSSVSGTRSETEQFSLKTRAKKTTARKNDRVALPAPPPSSLCPPSLCPPSASAPPSPRCDGARRQRRSSCCVPRFDRLRCRRLCFHRRGSRRRRTSATAGPADARALLLLVLLLHRRPFLLVGAARRCCAVVAVVAGERAALRTRAPHAPAPVHGAAVQCRGVVELQVRS